VVVQTAITSLYSTDLQFYFSWPIFKYFNLSNFLVMLFEFAVGWFFIFYFLFKKKTLLYVEESLSSAEF
jgi:hypothetical protein